MIINTNELATMVADRMVSIVDANRKSFIETDDFESVFENCFDMIVAPKIPKWAYEKTYSEVEQAAEIQMAYTVIKETIAEDRRDFEAREKDIAVGGHMYAALRERGLSQKDFL